MTLTTLVGPSAVLISKEVLTTAGRYSRTPPAGASYGLFKARGASGEAQTSGSGTVSNFWVASGSGAFVQGLLAVNPTDSIVAVVGAGGNPSGGYAGQSNGGGLSSIAIDGNTRMIAAGGGSASYNFTSNCWLFGGCGGIVSGTYGLIINPNGQNLGAPGTQTSGGGPNASLVNGGNGYFNGYPDTYAGGGGSSYIDAICQHALSQGGGYSSQRFGSLAVPGCPSDADFGATVGQGVGVTNNGTIGIDGGISIA